MFRTIFLPTLVAALIVVPLLYQKSNLGPEAFQRSQSGGGAGQYSEDYDYNYYVAQTPPSANPSFPAQTTPPFSRPPANPTAATPVSAQRPAIDSNFSAPSYPGSSSTVKNSGTRFLSVSSQRPVATPAIDFSQMTPDYGAIETRTYRGDAFGPDLNSEPMQFVPVSNFQEIFRFDVSPTWVKQRWQRLTSIPVQGGLHGLRTALVTGTNSWDLNGSLTYFFDQNHRVQRISFRGWVGDRTRLVNLATQHFGLKPQPTHWAGLYLAEFGGLKTGALLMKDPNTIDSRNQVQQTAVIMEINQPSGGFQLSQEVVGFLQPALPDN